MIENINVKEFLRDTNKLKICSDNDKSLLITLFVSLRNSFTFIFALILLIFDLIKTSKRRRIFKLLTKMVLNFLDFSTFSQLFIVKFQCGINIPIMQSIRR